MVRLFWISFFGFILLAWATLYIAGLPHHSQIFDLHFSPGHNHHHLSSSVLMWMLMALAMMLPTAIPFIRDYANMHKSTVSLLWVLCAGYALVWLGFALPASLLQNHLFIWQLVDHEGILNSKLYSGLLLIAVGLYQFSPFKRTCLHKCRQTTPFLLAHWRGGVSGAFRLGMLHGLYCLGCCWALMLLGFVGGVMNLLWMGLAMIIMALEKLPNIGKYLDRPLGIVLCGLGVVVLSL